MRPPICEDPTPSPVNKVQTALPAPCSVPFLKVPAPLTRSPTTAGRWSNTPFHCATPVSHVLSPEASAAGSRGRSGTNTLHLLGVLPPQEPFAVRVCLAGPAPSACGPCDLCGGAAILARGRRGRLPGLDLPQHRLRARRGPDYGALGRTSKQDRRACKGRRRRHQGSGPEEEGTTGERAEAMPSPRDVPPFCPPHPRLIPGLDPPLATFRLGPRPGEERPHRSGMPGVCRPRAAWPRPGRGRGERR